MRRVLLLAVVAGMAMTGCGTDASPAAAPRPADLDEVRDVFAADLAEMGLRLTDRGGVVDIEGGYTESATGRHLSLYVEPIGDRTTEQYVEGILDTARLLGPESFERWSAIDSFDVCQEPPTSVDDAEEPPPYTRVDLRREQAAEMDWDDLTLPAFLALAREQAGEGLTLYVATPVRETEVFGAALAAAGVSP